MCLDVGTKHTWYSNDIIIHMHAVDVVRYMHISSSNWHKEKGQTVSLLEPCIITLLVLQLLITIIILCDLLQEKGLFRIASRQKKSFVNLLVFSLSE